MYKYSNTCVFVLFLNSGRYWPFGSEGCQIHAFQGMVSILAAISFLAAIAWDRYHQYCTSEYKRASIKCYFIIFQY